MADENTSALSEVKASSLALWFEIISRELAISRDSGFGYWDPDAPSQLSEGGL